MGLFDKLKRNNKTDAKNATNTTEQLPFKIKYNMDNDNIQVDLYDENADFNKLYDSTRLILRRQALNMEGHQVYNCAVAWYGDCDHLELNRQTGQYESRRASDYRGVLAEIDLNLLQSDPNYCHMVMTNLLDKQRVERYLERGLQENPEQPCGKYIGGVARREKGYIKFFSPDVGRASHYSTLMINRRQEHKIEAERQQEIADKRAQIEKLQKEIEEMGK